VVNKKINTFVPSELSKVTRNLITVKYTWYGNKYKFKRLWFYNKIFTF
jgi:hypothetical protein